MTEWEWVLPLGLALLVLALLWLAVQGIDDRMK